MKTRYLENFRVRIYILLLSRLNLSKKDAEVPTKKLKPILNDKSVRIGIFVVPETSEKASVNKSGHLILED